MSSDIKPFIILDGNGRTAAVLHTNVKGYKKSIENSQIWAVDTETGRLLPEEGPGRVGSFRETDGWYEAVVKAGNDDSAGIDNISEALTSDDAAGKHAEAADSRIIERLFRVIEQRKAEMPEGSYTTHLFSSGLSKIKKKTGEEAVELLLAEDRNEIIYEAADLIYHMLVLFAAAGISPEEIFKELESRE